MRSLTIARSPSGRSIKKRPLFESHVYCWLRAASPFTELPRQSLTWLSGNDLFPRFRYLMQYNRPDGGDLQNGVKPSGPKTLSEHKPLLADDAEREEFMGFICQECGKSIHDEIAACPVCGARPIKKRNLLVAYLLGALVLLIVIAAMSASNPPSAPTTADRSTGAQSGP